MLATTDRPAVTPRLTTTVAKEYVHRSALAEVFLTGWNKTGPDTFAVTAQWPRSHSFYASEHGVHDPLLLCETVRQTFPLLAHAAYGVPFGYQLSWSHFRYAVNPQAMRIERSPAEMELQVTCSEIRYQRSLPASMALHIEVVRDGSLLAIASTRLGCHSPSVYQRLRAGRADIARVFAEAPVPSDPISPLLAGRARRADVVLAPTPQRTRWQLRADTAHPVLFDHAVDHAPGMLLLEAVRQAAHALTPTAAPEVPTSMDITFHRYVEFDSPCWIEADALPAESSDGRRSIRVNALQNGALAFTATTDMAAL